MSDRATWPRFDPPPRAAFLDVDGTLLAGTTTFYFAELLRVRGLIEPSYLIRMAYHGLQHRFGRLDYGRLLAFGLQRIREIPLPELDALARESFERQVRPRLYQGVVEHCRQLADSGVKLVLLSSSPEFILKPLGEHVSAAGIVSTPMRIEDGRIEGPVGGPPCYGPGKRAHAERWAVSEGLAMDECAAYADNWSDRSLLLRAGRAVVVHPRGRLLRLARRQGWIIVRPRRGVRPRRFRRHHPPVA
jgi:HAD superfamily hydrolase (TIGR01490 family)